MTKDIYMGGACEDCGCTVNECECDTDEGNFICNNTVWICPKTDTLQYTNNKDKSLVPVKVNDEHINSLSSEGVVEWVKETIHNMLRKK